MVIGSGPIGDRPIADIPAPDRQGARGPFYDLIADPSKPRVHLVELTPRVIYPHMDEPTWVGISVVGTGGSLGPGIYWYFVTAFNAWGETFFVDALSATVLTVTSVVSLAWNAVPGALGYRVHRGSSAFSTPAFLAEVTAPTTTYDDDGTATPAIARFAPWVNHTYTTQPAPLYVADQLFVTSPTDTPANRRYAPLITGSPLQFAQRAPRGNLLAGQATRANAGQLVLDNSTGELDAALDYAWDGATMVVLLGGPTYTYAQFGEIFRGEIEDIESIDGRSITVRLRSGDDRLAQPVQPVTYGGRGTIVSATIPHAFAWPTGGSLLASTSYHYRVTAEDAAGENLSLIAQAVMGSGPNTWRAKIVWRAVRGALRYKVYGRPTAYDGTYSLLATVAADVFEYIDDGSATLGSATYPGTNTTGNEGEADIQDVTKLLCYGRVVRIQPVMVDSTVPRFQFHAGLTPARELVAVYDSGDQLDEVPSSPGIGEYSVDLANGTFDLGFSPDGPGVITCDVDGASDPNITDRDASYASGPLLRYMIEQHYPGVALDGASFNALAERTGPAGIFINDGGITMRQLLPRVLEPAVTLWGRDRLGALHAFPLAIATEPVFTATDVASTIGLRMEGIDRVATAAPLWRISMLVARNYQTQDTGSLAAALTDQQKNALSQPGVSLVQIHERASAGHRLSDSIDLDTFLASTNAATELGLLREAFSRQRRTYRTVVHDVPWTVQPGQTMRVVSSRYGLASGQNFVIIGMDEDRASRLSTLEIWG